MVIKEKNLIETLHFAIIEMYNENMMPSLQACLQVTLKTALHRFAALKICDLHTYLNQNGSYVSYISGKAETQLKAIQEHCEALSQIQKYSANLVQ